MMADADIYTSDTVYTANEITFIRGGAGDVLEVLVYHNEDPNVVPEYGDMTEVALVQAPDPLAVGSRIDILTLVGPGVASLVDPGDVELVAGDHQRWGGVRTASEFKVFKLDTITVIGTT